MKLSSLFVPALLLALPTLAGCPDDDVDQSIAIISLSSMPARPDATSVTFTIAGANPKTFSLKGLTTSPVQLGLYPDGAPLGPQTVHAKVTASNACATLEGDGSITITNMKSARYNVDIVVRDSCGGGTDAGAPGPTDGGAPKQDAAVGTDGPAAPVPDAAVGMGMDMNTGVVQGNPAGLDNCKEVEHGVAFADCHYERNSDGVGDIAMYGVTFSPDGSLAVTAAGDGRIKFWKATAAGLEPDSRAPLTTNMQGRPVFSPDGKLLAIGGFDGDLYLYDLATKEKSYLMGHKGKVRSLKFLADGTRLVTMDSLRVVKVWDVATKSALTSIELFPNSVDADAWNLAITAHAPANAIWAAVGLEKTDELPITDAGTELPNDKAYVWFGNLANPSQFTLLPVDSEVVNAVAISPDDRWLVAAGRDSEAKIFDIQARDKPAPAGGIPALMTPGNGNIVDVQALTFSSDGRFLAVAYGGFGVGGGAKIFRTSNWSMVTQRIFIDPPGAPRFYLVSVAYRPQGDLVVFGEVGCGLALVCGE